MIHPVNIPDVFSTPPEDDDGEQSPFGRRSSLFRSNTGSVDFATDGRRLLTGNDAFQGEHVDSLWTRTLRGSFINRLRDGSLIDDPSSTNNISRTIPVQDDNTDGIVIHKLSTATLAGDRDRPLHVRGDLHIASNSEKHHTDKFDLVNKSDSAQLVIRRGHPFKLSLTLNRPYDQKHDTIAIVFQFGKNGTESRGTRVSLPCNGGHQDSGWSIDNVQINDQTATMNITSPSSCVVGVWMMEVRTTYTDENTIRDTICPVSVVYLLFNPWCPEDTVYMADAELRDEYVLNDLGVIWRGGHNSPVSQGWIFGQFEESVIEACMLLMDKAIATAPLRSSAVHVARAICQLANSDDDGGVLMGSWRCDFEGGVHPCAWTGSGGILREYAATGRSVKYGQCSTFAGLVCTVMRCVGIPCRVVTNYKSAHDSDTSCSVDLHYSLTTNSPMDEYNNDSVWNYHCWNDCWMERPDLPRGFGGWQALDATPQQITQGLCRVGPTSLRAVKEGEIGFGHDTAFVFSEINADHCEWLVDEKTKSMKLIPSAENKIGKKILTKKPGKHTKFSAPMDITSDYKNLKMTAAERTAVMNSMLSSHVTVISQYAQQQESIIKDVTCKLCMTDDAHIGDDFHVRLTVSNTSTDQPRTAKVSILVRSSTYTGRARQLIKNFYKMIQLQPGQSVSLQWIIQSEEYLDKMTEDASFMVSFMAHIPQTGQIFAETDDFQLLCPPLQIEVHKNMKIGESHEVELRVINPISRMLTACQFTAEGLGLSFPRKFKCQNIPPRTMASVKFTIKPWRTGENTLLAQFTSHQMTNVQGSAKINVNHE